MLYVPPLLKEMYQTLNCNNFAHNNVAKMGFTWCFLQKIKSENVLMKMRFPDKKIQAFYASNESIRKGSKVIFKKSFLVGSRI